MDSVNAVNNSILDQIDMKQTFLTIYTLFVVHLPFKLNKTQIESPRLLNPHLAQWSGES